MEQDNSPSRAAQFPTTVVTGSLSQSRNRPNVTKDREYTSDPPPPRTGSIV